MMLTFDLADRRMSNALLVGIANALADEIDRLEFPEPNFNHPRWRELNACCRELEQRGVDYTALVRCPTF